MPAQPSWFQNLETILAELQNLEASHLDRRAVEKLFGVGERRARQLMSGLPCLQVGNAAAVDRQALMERLEQVASGAEFRREITRRERVEVKLAELRRQSRARKVELPQASAPGSGMALPAAVRLVPGELTISFRGAKDLASKLFQLSQAMVKDWESFERQCSQVDH